MINKHSVLAITCLLLSIAANLNAQTGRGNGTPKPSSNPVTEQTAVTTDGRTVNLRSDGTWKYSDEKPLKPTPKSPWQEDTIQTAQRGGFTFDLKRARIAGGNVTLYLVITCHEENLSLGIGMRSSDRASVMWDNLGNRYYGNRTMLANDIDSTYPTKMVPELATKSAITFDGVSSETSSIASVKIDFWMTAPGNAGWIAVEFRNVPLSK